MRHTGRHQRGVVRTEPVPLAGDLGLGFSFEDRRLLVAVVPVERHVCAGRKSRNAAGDPRADLFGRERSRLNAVAAIDPRKRVDL